MFRRFATVLLLVAVSAVPAFAQQTAGAAEEKTSQTSHTMRLDGRDIKYTATAGTLPIRGEDGKVAARMFYVAYTKDGDDAKTRPVSFLYNGGPGAATVWLHMGSFAPRRVQMADEGFQPAPPYRFVDNDNSLLDVTDLVSDTAPGLPDGMTVAADGTIFTSGPGGILVISKDGKRLGRINDGKPTANCKFGDDGKTLYLTSKDMIARIRLNVKGAGF